MSAFTFDTSMVPKYGEMVSFYEENGRESYVVLSISNPDEFGKVTLFGTMWNNFDDANEDFRKCSAKLNFSQIFACAFYRISINDYGELDLKMYDEVINVKDYVYHHDIFNGNLFNHPFRKELTDYLNVFWCYGEFSML